MPAPNRRARRAAERELNRLQRRLNTHPDRPILRAPERRLHTPGAAIPPALSSPLLPEEGPGSSTLPQGSGPGTGGDASKAPATPEAFSPSLAATCPASATQAPPAHDGSTFPLWARLLTLPPNLDSDYRAFLFRHIQTIIAPRDDHEHWLAARIAVAMARLHVNAAREPESPSPAWLRYEQLSDRQLRQAHRDLKAHRATQPAPAAIPPSPLPDIPNPQSLRRPHDPTFARLHAPLPDTHEALLTEIEALTALIDARRRPVVPRPDA